MLAKSCARSGVCRLAYGALYPSKVLVTHRLRVRLGACGIRDATLHGQQQQQQPQQLRAAAAAAAAAATGRLSRNTTAAAPAPSSEGETLEERQQKDLLLLGKLLLALTFGNSVSDAKFGVPCGLFDLPCPHDPAHVCSQDCDVPSGLRMLMSDRSYSSEFKSFCCSLLSGASRRSLSYSASSLLEAYAAQALPLLEEEVSVGDRYESLLFAEMSRSRAFLLLCKLCFVVERGQLGAESNWSEVGDRYIARLFRDYLFFQQGAEGEPILDIAHVWDSVFKCDLGTAETAVLMSRDGASVLLLPFRDIKTSIDKSFRELVAAAAHGPTVAAATAVAAVSTPPAAASSPSHGPTTADAGAVAAAAVATRPPTMQAYSPLHHTPMGSMYPLQQQQQHSPPMYCLDTLGLYGPPMQPVQHSLQQHTHFPQEQQHSSFGPLNWQQQVLQMQPQKQQRTVPGVPLNAARVAQEYK
ncbi:PAN2-PAN3 deadenylation complex subunit PAN3-like [Cyclospora cayetanensis]|uniref:PAN2-PAN3 deadenylation complex subunit PAN3-like n=1 Tax=Cyclospora cayetanensis TaxID=88456 RepID=A0A6P6RYZ6_9EIME|nr:PAN2-PAN3 deadenylation complex subunit PAN3-like [Cyclospora cayetanensis]